MKSRKSWKIGIEKNPRSPMPGGLHQPILLHPFLSLEGYPFSDHCTALILTLSLFCIGNPMRGHNHERYWMSWRSEKVKCLLFPFRWMVMVKVLWIKMLDLPLNKVSKLNWQLNRKRCSTNLERYRLEKFRFQKDAKYKDSHLQNCKI